MRHKVPPWAWPVPWRERLQTNSKSAKSQRAAIFTRTLSLAPLPPNTSKMTPAQIASARCKAGLTRKELAAKINVSWRTVEKWEQGRGTPSRTALALLKLTFAESKEARPPTEKKSDFS